MKKILITADNNPKAASPVNIVGKVRPVTPRGLNRSKTGKLFVLNPQKTAPEAIRTDS